MGFVDPNAPVIENLGSTGAIQNVLISFKRLRSSMKKLTKWVATDPYNMRWQKTSQLCHPNQSRNKDCSLRFCIFSLCIFIKPSVPQKRIKLLISISTSTPSLQFPCLLPYSRWWSTLPSRRQSALQAVQMSRPETWVQPVPVVAMLNHDSAALSRLGCYWNDPQVPIIPWHMRKKNIKTFDSFIRFGG